MPRFENHAIFTEIFRMHSRFLSFLLFALPLSHLTASEDKAYAFVQTCKDRLIENRTIPGDAPGWFFPTREIKQLSLGRFWEKPWEEVSQNQSDPIPSMLEFHNLLADKNVSLLVVPIPAKATIYPEKFAMDFAPGEAQGISPFVEDLRAKGLNVLDLEPLFLEKRKVATDKKYWCQQDAHFSPAACVEVADLIAETLANEFGIGRKKNTALTRTEPREIEIKGDLIAFSEWENSNPHERLNVQFVESPSPLESDVKSPVLLLGDSHTLVFSDEENFHCDRAGLFDHLSAAIGSAVDLEGSAAGGLVTSRINLYRKAIQHPDYWSHKKVVVWVFTAREFTQSSYQRGFISVPIDR